MIQSVGNDDVHRHPLYIFIITRSNRQVYAQVPPSHQDLDSFFSVGSNPTLSSHSSLSWKCHPNQYRRLRDISMCITQDAYSTRLHHHGKWELHRISEPSFGERAKDVAMGNLKLTWILAFEERGDCKEAWMDVLSKRLLSYYLAYVVSVAPESSL